MAGFLRLNDVKFHTIDNRNEIEIKDGEYTVTVLSVCQIENLIDFLNTQLQNKKTIPVKLPRLK